MIWIKTVLFFTLSIPFIWILLLGYAILLKRAASVAGAARSIFVSIIYLGFAFLLLMPSVLGLMIIDSFGRNFETNIGYMYFYMCCIGASIVPGYHSFRKHHLEDLKKMGVF